MRWVAAIAAAAIVGGVVVADFPRPAPRSVTMTCKREPFNMTSTTPGVILEPVFICWRKLP